MGGGLALDGARGEPGDDAPLEDQHKDHERDGDDHGGGRDRSREEREKAFAETRTKMEELRKETEKAVQDVLTDSQKQQLAEMKGKEFNLDRSALFQGFGRGFGGGRPGGDGERRRSSDSNNNNSNNSN